MVTGALAKDLMADARAVFPVRRIEVIKSKLVARATVGRDLIPSFYGNGSRPKRRRATASSSIRR